MYSRCPKCGHTPLPADQSLPAACPGCGVILAKIGQTAVRRGDRSGTRVRSAEDVDDAGGHASEPARLTDAIPALLAGDDERVDPWHFWPRVALLAAFAAWGWMIMRMDYTTGEMNESFIHRPLLIFHEAGHVVFMILGHWVSVLGGTLGQLIMPLALGGALLWKNRDAFGAALGLWLFGVSLMDVAPYMYDALDPQLMLLSGATGEAGGHDWIFLFKSMGLLEQSQRIGGIVHKLGAAVMMIALGWGAWVLRGQHARLDAAPR